MRFALAIAASDRLTALEKGFHRFRRGPFRARYRRGGAEVYFEGGPGWEGTILEGSISPWNMRVISPASRRYQSLGRAAPSASSVSQKPWSGASCRRAASLNTAVLSFTSSNIAILSTVAPAI